MSDDREHLTSSDIFGDVLAEVEEEARRAAERRRAKPSLPTEDIERRLEETLSGVIPVVGKTRKRAAAPAEKPAAATDLPTESEIDALLDETLSSLDIPTRASKRPADAPAETTAEPAAASTAGEPAAAEPADGEFAAAEPAAAEPGAAEPGEPPRAARRADRDERPAAEAREAERSEQAPASVLELAGAPEGDLFRTQAMPTFDSLDDVRDGGKTGVADDGDDGDDGETFGEYTLLDRVAVGGMAEVWRARRRGVEGFRKTVAIKKILAHLTGSPDFVTMLIDEAKLAAQLNHNHIIQIYDLGKVDDDFFIAMEYVDGKDLRTILTAAEAARRPLPWGLGLLIVGAVARALDYAHRKRDFDHRALGLVHRDVSPQNVLISYEGEIKLCDFGIVKAVAKASTTQMGALKGKLQYMSPEQAWGKTVDARSDIFSLGAVAYEVLTGDKLFSGDSEIGVLDAVRECRIRSPRERVPELPEEVDRIVRRALAKEPEDRYQTAGDLEHDVKTVLDGLQPTPSPKDLARYLHELFAAPSTRPLPEDVVRVAKAAMAGVAGASADPSPPTATAPGAPVSGVPEPGAPVPGAPVPGAPVPDAPVPDAPVPDAPVPDAHVPDAPVLAAPETGVTEPAAIEPAAIEPAAIEPAAIEPAVPAFNEPATVEPAAFELPAPGATEPVAVPREPAAPEPAAPEPAAQQPDAQQPDAAPVAPAAWEADAPQPDAPEAPEPVPEESFLGLEDAPPRLEASGVFVPPAPMPDESAPLTDSLLATQPMPMPAASETPLAPAAAQPVAAAPATDASDPEAAPTAPARRRGTVWLLAAVLAAVAAGGYFVWQTRVADPPPPAQPAPAAVVEPAPVPAAPASTEPVATDPAAADPAAAGEPAEPAGEATGEPGAEPTAAGAAALDIEELVEQELSSRAERLRRDFEAEKRRIEEELARTREVAPPPAPDPDADDGGPGTR